MCVVMQTDPAHKIGALLCIDIIVQKIKEPYVTYFSSNIAKVRPSLLQVGHLHSSTSAPTRQPFPFCADVCRDMEAFW